MKKKQNKKFNSLGIVIAFLLLVFGVYLVTNKTVFTQLPDIQSSEFKNYTSEALKISFQYPKDWILSELGGRSINIVNPGEEKIKILITKTPMLQNQSFKDYIDIINRRADGVNRVLSEENLSLGYIGGTKRVIEPIVGNDLRKYVIIFVENNNFIYSVSVTPADSELIPIFNKIVKSIEFK